MSPSQVELEVKPSEFEGLGGAAAGTEHGSKSEREAVMEKIMWLVLGGIAFVAAMKSGQSRRAMYVGRGALGVLFIAFGAAVNAIYLAAGTDYYEDFANPSPFPFVRDTWESLVLPNQGFFISLLIIAEATTGVLVLSGGRWTRRPHRPSSVSTSGNWRSVEFCGFGRH